MRNGEGNINSISCIKLVKRACGFAAIATLGVLPVLGFAESDQNSRKEAKAAKSLDGGRGEKHAVHWGYAGASGAAHLDTLDGIDNQQAQFPVEGVEIQHVIESAAGHEGMVASRRPGVLEGNPVTAQSVVTDVGQIKTGALEKGVSSRREGGQFSHYNIGAAGLDSNHGQTPAHCVCWCPVPHHLPR